MMVDSLEMRQLAREILRHANEPLPEPPTSSIRLWSDYDEAVADRNEAVYELAVALAEHYLAAS